MRVPFQSKRQERSKDPMFNNGSHDKFQFLQKQVLESSNKPNFEKIVQKLEDFLHEEMEHEKLKDWLKWWVLEKEYIF